MIVATQNNCILAVAVRAQLRSRAEPIRPTAATSSPGPVGGGDAGTKTTNPLHAEIHRGVTLKKPTAATSSPGPVGGGDAGTTKINPLHAAIHKGVKLKKLTAATSSPGAVGGGDAGTKTINPIHAAIHKGVKLKKPTAATSTELPAKQPASDPMQSLKQHKLLKEAQILRERRAKIKDASSDSDDSDDSEWSTSSSS